MSHNTMRGLSNVVVVGGVEYANPLKDDRYLVKLFPIPAQDDLAGHIRLMESFERRFLHSADGGRKAQRQANLDSYIDEKRAAYEAKTGGEKELEGAALCIALLERGIRRAKRHMLLRIKFAQEIVSPEDIKRRDALLDDLKHRTEEDLMDAGDLFKYVRRRRGHLDVDRVLDEMKGEPYNIFLGTLPGVENKLEFFRNNRMAKAAMAMQCIDGVVEKMGGLAVSHKQLEDAGMPAMLKELAEAAKLRLQLQRDDPDFAQADLRLTVARNALMRFIPAKVLPAQQLQHLPADYMARQQVSPTTVALLKEAGELIYDIALVRGARRWSANNLAERAEEHQPQVSRIMRPTGTA